MNAQTTANPIRTATRSSSIAAAVISLLFTAHAAAEDRTPRGVTWTFEWENDSIFNSDNQFTNGFFLEKNGPAVQDWTLAKGTPAFGKKMAAWFLPEDRDGLWFRESWSVGQVLQTPDDLSRSDPILDDVPYAALLGVQNAWIAYDDRDFHGFGWLYGIVGPAALGEPVQSGFHSLIGADDPKGWSNQIDTEPAVNLYYERKHKLARARWGDVAVGVGASVGNVFTAAKVSLESRVGFNLPEGFVRLPDPFVLGLTYEATAPREGTRQAVYASLAVRTMFNAYSIFLDGNISGDSQSIDYNRTLHAVIVGVHYERRRWGAHFNWLFSTDTLDDNVVTSEEDTNLNYGTLTLDFRY